MSLSRAAWITVTGDLRDRLPAAARQRLRRLQRGARLRRAVRRGQPASLRPRVGSSGRRRWRRWTARCARAASAPGSVAAPTPAARARSRARARATCPARTAGAGRCSARCRRGGRAACGSPRAPAPDSRRSACRTTSSSSGGQRLVHQHARRAAQDPHARVDDRRGDHQRHDRVQLLARRSPRSARARRSTATEVAASARRCAASPSSAGESCARACRYR